MNKKKTWLKNGIIKGTLTKDKDKSVGERVLPWRRLTSKMISNLPDYQTHDYFMISLLTRAEWVYLTEGFSDAVDQDKPYPRHQLRDLCKALMVESLHSKDRMFCIPRKQRKGTTPLDLYQRTIILEDLKIFEDKPTMFLTFYDHDLGKSLLEDTHLPFMDLREFGDLQDPKEFKDILLEGYDILKAILKVNSHRIQQDVDLPWKMKSFLRMRYPFKISSAFELETKTMTKFTEGGLWKSPEAHLEYLQMMLEISETAPPSQRGEKLDAVRASVGFFKPVCDSCGRMTDCKMCTACNKVYYCSRSCQRRAWPQHKVYCSK